MWSPIRLFSNLRILNPIDREFIQLIDTPGQPKLKQGWGFVGYGAAVGC